MADNLILGVWGSVTGTLGLGVSVIALLTTRRNNLSTLRLRLAAEVAQLRSDLTHLPDTIQRAQRSRHRVNAAKGLARSGAQIKFDEDVTADATAVDGLSAQCGDVGTDFDNWNQAKVESEIRKVNELSIEAKRLATKYHGALAADELSRQQIQQAHVAMAAARMAQPSTKKLLGE